MTPSVFYAACLALWGETWKPGAMRDLRISDRTIRRYIAGDDVPNLGIQSEIRDRLIRKRGELSAIVAAIPVPPVQS